MNDAERKARAERARTYRDEFLAPVVDTLRDSYRVRMIDIATTELNEKARAEKITALSFALKLIDNITTHLDAAVADGAIVEKSLLRAENIEKLNPHQRRLLGVVPY